MPKHTPGPWRIGKKTEKQHTRIEQARADGDGHYAVTVAWINDDTATVPDASGIIGETWRANASLIVTAPRLLASLKNLLSYDRCCNNRINETGEYYKSEEMKAAFDEAYAAVAQAEEASDPASELSKEIYAEFLTQLKKLQPKELEKLGKVLVDRYTYIGR